jgi:hypothetical protein
VSAEEDITEELVRLRRGWGLQDRSLRARVGPKLAVLSGVTDADSDRDVREKVRRWLDAIRADLPPELSRAAVMAFAIDRNEQYGQLTGRVELFANEQSWSTRTARRRMDQATRMMAQAAADRQADADNTDPEAGWRMRLLRAVLRLDTTQPELHETRVIVAGRADLDRIAVRLSAATPPCSPYGEQDIVADVVYGAKVLDIERRLNSQHFRWILKLPVALQPGDEHEFHVIYRLPPERPIRPHYAMLPLTPCDRVEMRVRFGAERPSTIWRLDAVPPRLLDDDQPGEHRLTLDEAGEVRLVFTSLKQGRGYGLKWLL